MTRTRRPLRLASAALIVSVLFSRLFAAGVVGATPSSFTSRADALVASVAPGQSVALNVHVSSTSTSTVLVDVEVYDASGRQVFQSALDDQVLVAGAERRYDVSWSVPATLPPGTYVVKVGLFAPRWGTLYHWADRLAVVRVEALPEATQGPGSSQAPSPGAATGQVPTKGEQKFFGVNVSGAEFGERGVPGSLNRDYVYSVDTIRQGYYPSKGLTLVRVPVVWERLQLSKGAALSPAGVAGVRSMLDAATASGQQLILDLHNYGRYFDQPLRRADGAAFADLWERIAKEFAGHPALYGYELMNEPHDLPEGADSWAFLAQVGADAIRKHDTTAWILVPGYDWQSAERWAQSNSTLNVSDSAGKLLYAAHQYFDPDASGKYSAGYTGYETIGADRVRPFVEWLDAHNARGIITEYGVPDTDARWLTVLDTFLTTLSSEPRIVGGTYWAGGPWWGDYSLSAEPRNGADRPQMAILAKYPSVAPTLARPAST